MNTIVIQGSEYKFEEKTYGVNKNMSFRLKLARFIKEEQVVCLCLLKSLIINIENEIINFREFDKKIKNNALFTIYRKR